MKKISSASDLIKRDRDRVRIFLILFFFSEECKENHMPNYKKLFETEIKLQKLDFWIRNPDYLAYSLLDIAKECSIKKQEIRDIVKKIFRDREPDIRKEEMRKLLYGAYEDLDEVISFLESVDLIRFRSNKNVSLDKVNKRYYITDLGVNKVESNLEKLPFLKWYEERCCLIKKYFGDKTGTQLKDIQYKVDAYAQASYGEIIPNISNHVEDKYQKIYGEKL